MSQSTIVTQKKKKTILSTFLAVVKLYFRNANVFSWLVKANSEFSLNSATQQALVNRFVMYASTGAGFNQSTTDITFWNQTLTDSEMISQLAAPSIFSVAWNFTANYTSNRGGNILGTDSYEIVYDAFINKNVLSGNGVYLYCWCCLIVV